MCLIEGERSVTSALVAGAELEFVVYTLSFDGTDVIVEATKKGVSLVLVDDREMQNLSDVQTPQGIMAVARSPLVSGLSLQDSGSVLILDGIQDPGNAGTLIRTAAWFGIEAVLAAGGTVDMLSPKVIRSTMGGMWDIRIGRTNSISDWMDGWKSKGGTVVAGDMSGINVSDWAPPPRTALVIGGEANGVSREMKTHLDVRVLIGRPADSGDIIGVESLNAAVAGGILMAHWAATG